MRIFISYSHRDVGVLNRLRDHFATLRRKKYITEWYDRVILAGDVLDEKIGEELENADIFLLLVSPDFIASDYCVGREMRRALERHEAGEARVVPIIVEPCDWEETDDLRKLKALPKDGCPISEWANPNRAYLDIVQGLRRIIEAKISNFAKVKVHKTAHVAEIRDLPQYRARRDFDEIDCSEYRDAAFATIKGYFRKKVLEVNSINGLRGRFVDHNATSFGATVVNSRLQHGTAHITVHRRSTGFAFGDIYFSFDKNAPENSANGWFSISSDDYEQFLVATMPMGYGGESVRLNPDQAAKCLWDQFIKQAGIDYA